MEAATGFEPVIRVLQTRALPLGYAALLKTESGRRDSNSRPPPWQGGVLPLNYFRINWLGYLGSNQGMTESKSVALPLGYSPTKMGRLMGIEPTNAGITIRCVNHFATTATINYKIGRGSRNRTHIKGFGDLRFTIKLYP